MQTQNSATVTLTPQRQLDVARSLANVRLSAPMYYMPVKADDLIHQVAEGRMLQGEAAAFAMREIEAGRVFRPVQWTSVTWVDDLIDVAYQIPTGATMKFDTDWVPSIANHGFELLDAGGVTITNVAFLGAQTIRLTLSGIPSGTPKLAYARGGGQGTAITHTSKTYTRPDPYGGTDLSVTFTNGYKSTRGTIMAETDMPSPYRAMGFCVPPYVRCYAACEELVLSPGLNSLTFDN